MATVVQCTNCGKKLKLKTPAPGKKLRCPACKEPFVLPEAGPKKKKKRRAPAPVDDFDDFGDDYGDDMGGDDFGEAAPPRKKKKGGKKKAAAASSGGKSKAPLFIGVGVLGLALAGSLVFFLLPDGDDSSTEVAATDSTAPADSADGTDVGEEEMYSDEEAMMAEMAGAEHGGPDEEYSGSTNGGPAPGGSPSAPTGSGASIDMKWLPANAEVVAKIDINRLLAGPVGQLLNSPAVAASLAGFRQQVGFGPEAIESVTLGVAGVSAAASGDQPPTPADLPTVGVIRVKSAIDISKLQGVIPGAVAVDTGQPAYIRLPAEQPGQPPFAMWAPDANTVLVAAESAVQSVSAGSGTTPASHIDAGLLNSNTAIHVAFVPTNPDDVFRKDPVPDQVSDPSKQPMVDFAKVVQPVMSGLTFAFDLGTDMNLKAAIVTPSPTDGQNTVAALQKLIADMKQLQQQGSAGELPAMMAMAMQQGAAALDAVQVSSNGNSAEVSFTAPGAGQQLAMMGPMLPMMIGNAMSQAQQFQMGPGGFGGPPQDPLRNISLAMLNFHDIYGRFPNAASKSDDGTPLLSWRVHILPFLGYEDLYDEFNLDEPWNSDHNKALVDQMPEIYASPDVTDPSRTVLLVPTAAGTAFEDAAGHSLTDFTDGTSNTILVIQAPPESSVIWTQPVDYTGDGANLPDNVRTALADGSTHDVPKASLKPMLTRNGGEVVQLPGR